jgi:hypothetical protein
MRKVTNVHNRWIRVLASLPNPGLLQRHIRFHNEGFIEAIETAYSYQHAIVDSLQTDDDHKAKSIHVHRNLDFMILDLISAFEHQFEKTGQWNSPDLILPGDHERADR